MDGIVRNGGYIQTEKNDYTCPACMHVYSAVTYYCSDKYFILSLMIVQFVCI